MQAIILAGGEGTRLRPLTYKIPKALIPIGDKTLTELALDIYKNIGVTDFYLSISYLADQMVEYFDSGEKFGCQINFLREDKALGTAGPLIILKQMGKIFDQDFFMSNGDNLFALDLKAMIDFHQKNQAIATIALTEVEDPTHFGIAKLAGDKIVDFIEKPAIELAPSRYANSGYYILSPKIFDYLPEKDFVMVEKDIFPAIAKAGKLFGFKSQAQWFDTGTPERYEKVKKEWAGPYKY
ncbi:MAG: nucleotidyltransferase family protein [Candidatus Buchananbacteria bacterium]